MCGLAGLIEPSHATKGTDPRDIAERMASTLANRGPDDTGVWSDDRFAMAFRRLAVIDLTQTGHQPMTSRSGRFVIAYNGEIYNFGDLRRDLERGGMQFRGHSDTEVLLEGIATWGLQPTLERANGMFAIALWDRAKHRLLLARDRVGEKPLYYGWAGDSLVFGSELTALRMHPRARFEIDRRALAAYFQYGYVPAPRSIYHGVYKVMPGTIIEINAADLRNPRLTRYWSAFDVATAGLRGLTTRTPQEAADEVEELLEDSVARRMVADVPTGAFLSGGIDSSVVVALMQQRHSRPVRTFSVGFEEARWNEAHHAAEVARRLGTEHTELHVTPTEVIDLLPQLGSIYDEPLGDASQIPMVLVSALARQEVTVVLSGDGGDELFCGYDRYEAVGGIWRGIERLPSPLRRASALTIGALRPSTVDRLVGIVGPVLPKRLRTPRPGARSRRFASMLNARSPMDAYQRLSSHVPNGASLVVDGGDAPMTLTDHGLCPEDADPQACAMYFDTVSYLPNDILTKLDRATMSVGLEGRVPILDHRLVELAWHLPMSMKRREGVGKRILRDVLARHLPITMFDRPKMGFGAPVGDWLRGPLRPWASELLNPTDLADAGYLETSAVTGLWNDHLTGRQDASLALWDVLMFQEWLRAHERH